MTQPLERRFEALFSAHSTPILGYLLRRVDSAEDAADLMAEVFTVAWRRIHRAPEGDEARLWLYGIARNVLANHRRGRARRGRLADRLREQLAIRADTGHSNGDDRVRNALATLPERDQEILTLSAWEQLAPGEIATVLGLTAVNARARLSRARARLRTALAAHSPDDLATDLPLRVNPSSPSEAL